MARKIFVLQGAEVGFPAHKLDGDKMISGEKAFEVNASVHTILVVKDLVLNCMQRMSGIATLTKIYTLTR